MFSVGSLQLVSDKSQTSMKAGLHAFNPLHITFLNCAGEQRRWHTISGRTICAQLPVHFWRKNDDFEDWKLSLLNKGSEHKERFKRIELFQALHESASFSLERLTQCAMTGLQCNSTNGECVLFYFVIAYYISDIPKCEGMLAVKHSMSTLKPCHNCLPSRNEFALN